jgi:hypothetical protein
MRRTHSGLVAGLAAALGAALVVGLFVAGSMLAQGGASGPAVAAFTTTPSPTPTGDPSPDGGTPTYGSVKNCAIVSSSSYLGMSCAGSDGGGKTVKQILGPSDVPGCWDEPLTDTELAAMNVENKDGPDGWTYYWDKCLSGIDPVTKTIEPEGIKITVELKRIDHGDPVKTLDPRQWDLVRGLERNGNIPVPVAGVSPADHARVGGDVSFFDGTKDVVQVSVGTVVLRAHVESIDIEPLGPGREPKISCPDAGVVAQAGDTPQSRPNGCWYRYLRSSAGQERDAYPVQITAHWRVESSADGGATFTPFNSFTKSAITRIPVTEVQTLVVQ